MRSARSLCFEEHASVLAHWFERGFRKRTLICLDAHLDLQCISKSRLDRLKHAQDADAIARLMKPHHWYPDQNTVTKTDYSYSIEDFLYAAKHLGIIDRLIWVAPPHIPIFDPTAAIEQLQQSDGVDLESLASLHVIEGETNGHPWIQGVLYGLPITICREQALASCELPPDALVDIDIDYFIELPTEQIGRSPQDTANCLLELDLDFNEVTISSSVSSGYTPANFGWISPSLADAFNHGESEAMDDKISGEDFPADPPENAGELLRRLSRYAARGIEPSQREFNWLISWSRLFVDGADCEENGLVNAGVGLLQLAAGDCVGAKKSYERAATVFGCHPELALEIAKHHLNQGDFDEAETCFMQATLDDKTRSFANHYLGAIGMIRFQKSGESHSLDLAIDYLESARRSAAVWTENLNLLSHAYATRGDVTASQSCQEEICQVSDICQQFNQQLEPPIDESSSTR